MDKAQAKPAARKKIGEALKLAEYLQCVFLRRNHEYVNSKSRPGYITCIRCRHRRRNNM